MKNSIRVLALSLAAATAAYSAPFLAVGDGAELFLTGTLGVRADDNIYLSPDKVSDTIFSVNPGLDFTFGKGATTQGDFSFTENIDRYSQNNNLDTELAALNFYTRYDNGVSKFNTQASYNELNQNTVDIRGDSLVRRNVTNIGANGEFAATAKSKVGIGATYNNTDYSRAGYSDLTTVDVPLNYYYAVTSKVDLSFGFKYRNTTVAGGIDSKDYFYTVGARGDFTPKMTGSVSVGYGQRDFDGGSSKDIINLDAMLNVALTPKSTLQLTASNDFGVSAAGQEQKNFSLGGIVSTKVTDQFSFRGGLSYRAIDYYTRTDDYIEGQLGADYVVSTHATLSASYAYRHNSSDLASAEFTGNVFSIAASFRY
jgi:hypothetical protein